MRVWNKKARKWVELPDPEPTEEEAFGMYVRKLKSTYVMAFHDNMPPHYRKATREREY